MLISEINRLSLDQLLTFLNGKPEFIGEAIAKAAYSELTRNYQEQNGVKNDLIS